MSATGPEKEALGACIEDLNSKLLAALRPDRPPLPTEEIRALVVPWERRAKAAQKAALKSAEAKRKLLSFEDAVVRGAAAGGDGEDEDEQAGAAAAGAEDGAAASLLSPSANAKRGTCFICCTDDVPLLLCGAAGCTFEGCCGGCYATWLQKQAEELRDEACCMGTRADGSKCRAPFTVAALAAAKLPKAKARRLVDAARRGAVLRADSEWKQKTLIHIMPLVREHNSIAESLAPHSGEVASSRLETRVDKMEKLRRILQLWSLRRLSKRTTKAELRQRLQSASLAHSLSLDSFPSFHVQLC